MGLFKEAQKFILKQRIKELENALEHWPNSERADERNRELLFKLAELHDLEAEESNV